MFASGDGGVVWEAATATLAHLEATYGDCALQGQRVLELGAGTGLCGLACAALGASHVTLTDLPSALPLLRANAESSAHASCVETPHLAPSSKRTQSTRASDAAIMRGVRPLLRCRDASAPASRRRDKHPEFP